MNWYMLPLTPYEGLQLIPALISASQQMGLESYRANGALTTLEDGTQLSWQTSANERDFILLVVLPSDVPKEERGSRFNAAKLRADDIWARAAALRAQALGL